MRHIMIDLETLSSRPDAYILAIAAQVFDPHTGKSGEAVHWNLSQSHQESRHIDPGTVRWWFQQSRQAQLAAFAEPQHDLPSALAALASLCRRHRIKRVWCKGPSFDAVILEHAYRATGIDCPWWFHQTRDVRTILEVAQIRADTPASHLAAEDVAQQIRLVCQAFQAVWIVKPTEET